MQKTESGATMCVCVCVLEGVGGVSVGQMHVISDEVHSIIGE